MLPDPSNKYFEMAVQYVNHTAQPIFLTGKAGTGKTTFLRYIKQHSYKKMAVLAPTGVAAINAAGNTIHSFFQLPFGSFLPEIVEIPESANSNYYNRKSLLKHLRLTTAKRELMQELDLLIIDEVSMVRADLLDAVDTVLKHIRRQPHLPFGGVQMLYIGDLSQLPPVVNEQEWKILSQFYQSPFFFHAHALQQSPPVYLELKKIYRQSDETFIKLLNNVRNSQVRTEDLQLLNSFYKPDFKPETKGEYITLTTHNAKADVINQHELQSLPGRIHTFEAAVEGNFSENSFPAESKLQLKVGAQVMFIRNDKGEIRRYYNGKIGTIKRIEDDEIYVVFPGETEELLVEKETWTNQRYHYNKEKDQIEEELIGTFTQYPIRLAWAITIHKSQGLTFKKAIIDAGESFAPGQVYVALSRLTSLDGLILYSRIEPHCISTDKQANAFSHTEQEAKALEDQLKVAQKIYLHQLLLQAFNWKKVVGEVEGFWNSMDDRRIPQVEEAKAMAGALLIKVREQEKTAEKFALQLERMMTTAEEQGYEKIHERVEAAYRYFSDALHADVFVPLQQHYEDMRKKSRVKKYLKEVQSLVISCKNKKSQLEQVVLIAAGLVKGTEPAQLFKEIENAKKKEIEKINKKKEEVKAKPVKGESHRITLELFKEGKSIEEIAEERNLAIGTIESHLASFIPTGEVGLYELVSEEKVKVIQQVINDLGGDVTASTPVKEKLGDEFTYGEIKAVITYNKSKKEG